MDQPNFHKFSRQLLLDMYRQVFGWRRFFIGSWWELKCSPLSFLAGRRWRS